MIDQKQEAVRKELYDQWREHPITGILLNNLEKDKQFFVDKISQSATDSDVTNDKIRYYGFGIKNMDSVLAMITNYEKFTKYDKPIHIIEAA